MLRRGYSVFERLLGEKKQSRFLFPFFLINLISFLFYCTDAAAALLKQR